MADRIAEQGALQDAISNNEINPPRLSLAGYIRGLFLDWSASPYNPLTRLTARGRYLGYFWDNGAIGLSMDFANQSFIVKDGTLQSKSFSDIVNFSRTSNATVTNSAGVIAYAPHNLLTFSEQFDNAAWTKTTTTVTANAIASPNNTTTGDTLTASGANSTTLHSYTAIAQPYTFSIYIRRRTGTGTINITADGSTYVAKTITSDWARFDTTITPTAGARTPGVRIVTSGDAIDVWGAQLEIGSTATTYNPTTVKNLLGYSELFDNAAWTKSNSFVQTNLLTYSETFDNAAWTGSGATVTANNIIAPNGYQTADKVTISGSDSLRNTNAIVITTGTQYTVSISAKKNDFDWLRISVGNVAALTNSVRVWFNLATGVVGSNTTSGTGWAFVSATITPQSNDFYRITVCYTGTATDNFVSLASSDGNGSLVRAANGSSYYIWGAQLVQGSVAGDYRRTDAAALPIYYPNHNGVVVAEKIVENTATAYHAISGTTITAGTYMASIYAKAGERNFLQLAGGVSVNDYITFNLSTGVITQTGSGASLGSITAVGNGWYRCSVRLSFATTGVYVTVCQTGTGGWLPSAAGNGTSGIYIFGAQVSDSASLDPYVLTAAAAPTAAAYYGPRFDYDPVTLQPKGLLIEEQRTNLLQSTTAFNNTAYGWYNNSGFYSIVTLNDTTGVDGTLSGAKLAATATSNNYLRNQLSGQSNNTVDTLSVYMKKGNINFGVLRNIAISGAPYAWFNLNNGTVGTVQAGLTATITNAGNGWYRCSITGTTLASIVNNLIDIVPAATDNSQTVTIGDYIYIDRPQLENGAFSTSHIPTVASQVTRTADVATIQGSNFYSWYNQNEGSIYTQFSMLGYSSFNAIISAYLNSTNFIALDVNSSFVPRFVVENATNQVNLVAQSGAISANTVYKLSSAYKINDFAIDINTDTIKLNTSGTLPIANTLNIGSRTGAAQFMNGTIKQISYYPVRLSNDVLKGLTA
jgi:hypothetical protein